MNNVRTLYQNNTVLTTAPSSTYFLTIVSISAKIPHLFTHVAQLL